MKKYLPVIMSLAAVVFGIVFVVNGITTISQKDLYDTNVTATVVDIQEEWVTAADPDDSGHTERTAYIDYEVNGTKFEHIIAPEQDDNLKVGDKVEILCQSKDPSKISSQNPEKGGIIFIALGALVAIVGLFMAIKLFIKR